MTPLDDGIEAWAIAVTPPSSPRPAPVAMAAFLPLLIPWAGEA
jgi:hypothetical protein